MLKKSSPRPKFISWENTRLSVFLIYLNFLHDQFQFDFFCFCEECNKQRTFETFKITKDREDLKNSKNYEKYYQVKN